MADQGWHRVLVVGASAAGLTAAHELARRGSSVRVLDTGRRPATTRRSVALHPVVLETLDQMGLVGEFLAHGSGRGTDAGRPSGSTRYRSAVVIERARVEALLREAVAALGVTVERGVRPQHHAGPQGTGPPWLITCDGTADTADGDTRRFTAGAGQDLNRGIQEAHNLAWKLAMVDQGHAGSGLLRTYGEEHPQHPQAPPAAGGRVPGLSGTLRRRAAQQRPRLRHGYPNSSLTSWNCLDFISGYHVGAAGPLRTPVPEPGARVTTAGAVVRDALRDELRDPRWLLLHAADGDRRRGGPAAVAGAAAAQYGAWLSVRALGAKREGLPDPDGPLRAALGTPPGGWLLIRPDGYVAARGTSLTAAELDRALSPLAVTPLTPPIPLIPLITETTGAPSCG